MIDRDAVCWHCLDCVTVPARTRCEHCPEECDVEGCDAPGCNGQVATASPWRSLKDDPPDYPAPIGMSILVRRGMGYSGTTSRRWWQHKVLDQEPEKALRHDWEEWMEVPS